MKFKIGDTVEGQKDGRWVRGTVVCFHSRERDLGVDVMESKKLDNYVPHLHNLEHNINKNNGWYIPVDTAKHAKNYLVKQIIEDL